MHVDHAELPVIVLAVGLLLYIYRHVVEDRTGVPLREETPTMPPADERATASTAPAV